VIVQGILGGLRVTGRFTLSDVPGQTSPQIALALLHGVLGQVSDCGFGILDNATLAGWVPASAGNGPQFFRCYTANLAAENGALMTPVSA